jgi:hypothetical protein
MQTLRILRPDLNEEQLEQAWSIYHARTSVGSSLARPYRWSSTDLFVIAVVANAA